MGILLIFIGGLVFLYFNVKFWVKINLSLYFIHVSCYIIFLKKKYLYEKTLNYFNTSKIINEYKIIGEKYKLKKLKKYFKYFKKLFSLFFIKNIQFYPECIFEKQSVSIEFVVVNRVLKSSLLNG